MREPDPDPDPLRFFLVSPPTAPISPKSAHPAPPRCPQPSDPHAAAPDPHAEGSLAPAHAVDGEIERAESPGPRSQVSSPPGQSGAETAATPQSEMQELKSPIKVAEKGPSMPSCQVQEEASVQGEPTRKVQREASLPEEMACQVQRETSMPEEPACLVQDEASLPEVPKKKPSMEQQQVNALPQASPSTVPVESMPTIQIPASPTKIDQDLQEKIWEILPDLAKELKQHEQQQKDLTTSKEACNPLGNSASFTNEQFNASDHSMGTAVQESFDVAAILSSRFSASQKGKQAQTTHVHDDNLNHTETATMDNSSKSTRPEMSTFHASTIEEGWEPARTPRKHRSTQEQSRAFKPHNHHASKPSGFDFFKSKLEGRCFNCFSPNHIARDCNSIYRCWKCFRPGHRAVECSQKQRQERYKEAEQRRIEAPASKFTTTQQLQTHFDKASRPSYAEVVRGGTDMAAPRYPGDPRARPDRGYCAVTATGPIRRRRDDLINRAAVCWLHSSTHDTKSHHLGEALRGRLHLRHDDLQILEHYPEQFLIIFKEPADRDRLLDMGSIYDGGRDFSFAPWSERRNAVNVTWEFRVKVRVEGIPPHCWAEEVAAKAIGRSCSIHYLEEKTRRRERTRTFDLWAWSSNPCDIPKEVVLTVTEPDREPPPTTIPFRQAPQHRDDPSDLKRGHAFILRNHLEWVEDLTFLQGRGREGGPSNRMARRELLWSYGVPDYAGERVIGRRNEDRGREMGRYHRRDDEDRDRDRDHRSHGTRRHRSTSSWVRNSRCRGAIEDCVSSSRWRGGRSPPPRSRAAAMPRLEWRVKEKKNKIKKRVTFADPIATELKPPKPRLRDDSILLIKESGIALEIKDGQAAAGNVNSTSIPEPKDIVMDTAVAAEPAVEGAKVQAQVLSPNKINTVATEPAAVEEGHQYQAIYDNDNTLPESKDITMDTAEEEVAAQEKELPTINNNTATTVETSNNNTATEPVEQQLMTEVIKMVNLELTKSYNDKHFQRPVELSKMTAIQIMIEQEKKKRARVGRKTSAQVQLEA